MKTIYKNGAVYTGKLPLVEAFAVEDGSVFVNCFNIIILLLSSKFDSIIFFPVAQYKK